MYPIPSLCCFVKLWNFSSYLSQIRESFSISLPGHEKVDCRKRILNIRWLIWSQNSVKQFNLGFNAFILEFFCIPFLLSSENIQETRLPTSHPVRTLGRDGVDKSEALVSLSHQSVSKVKNIWRMYVLRALFLNILILWRDFLVRIASTNSEVEQHIFWF